MSIYIVSVRAVIFDSEYEGCTTMDRIFHVCFDLETAQKLYNKIDNTVSVYLKSDYDHLQEKEGKDIESQKVTQKTLSKAPINADISDIDKLETLELEKFSELVLTDKFPSLDRRSSIRLLKVEKRPYDCVCYDAGYGRVFYYVEPDVVYSVDEDGKEWLKTNRKRGSPSIDAHIKRGPTKKMARTDVEIELEKLKKLGYKMIVRGTCTKRNGLDCVAWNF